MVLPFGNARPSINENAFDDEETIGPQSIVEFELRPRSAETLKEASEMICLLDRVFTNDHVLETLQHPDLDDEEAVQQFQERLLQAQKSSITDFETITDGAVLSLLSQVQLCRDMDEIRYQSSNKEVATSIQGLHEEVLKDNDDEDIDVLARQLECLSSFQPLHKAHELFIDPLNFELPELY